MPTIIPQVRAQINADPENFQQPRRSITQSTGMIMPPKAQTVAAAPKLPQTGQPVTQVDPAAQAPALSPQLTALTRQKQKLQQEIQAQRDKEVEWEKQKAAYVPRDSIKTRLQQNAAEVLAELGVNYDELTNLLVTQQNGGDPVQALAAEVKELKTAQSQAADKQFQAIVNQYKAEAKSLVSKDAQKFAFLEANPEWIDGAVQHIVDEWEENPDNIVSIDEALALAEETLRDDAEKSAAVLAKVKKPAVTQEEAPVTPGTKTLPPPKTTAPRTLSHSVESTPTRTYNQFQHLSPRERLQQAIARATK